MKPKDLVYSKIGKNPPVMVVIKDWGNLVLCQWVDENKEIKRAVYHTGTLERVPDKDPPK